MESLNGLTRDISQEEIWLLNSGMDSDFSDYTIVFNIFFSASSKRPSGHGLLLGCSLP